MSLTTLILIGHQGEITVNASCGRRGWLCSQKADITDKLLDREQFVTFSLHSTPVRVSRTLSCYDNDHQV